MNRFLSIIISLSIAIGANASQADDIIAKTKKQYAPDSRQTVFDIKTKKIKGGKIMLSGQTSDIAAHDALIADLKKAGIKYIDSITIYPDDRFGLISIPVATMRTRGSHSAETASQAVLGTPVRLLENKNDWWRIQTPDGYIAWIPTSSVSEKNTNEINRWKENPDRYVINGFHQTYAYSHNIGSDGGGTRDIVTDLVPGSIIETAGNPIDGYIRITLPDGRSAWIDSNRLTQITEWASQDYDHNLILDAAYALMGAPYLWGGTSAKCVDCSGLVKVSHLCNGLILMRDASQQVKTGQKLGTDYHNYIPGDLLFFGDKKTGRVTHVGIYDNNSFFIHSSGRVKRNSLDPESADYLYSPLEAVRIQGNEGSAGITKAINHPWYFNLNN